MVTGALADPKDGPDPTETSFADLLWEAAGNGLSSKQSQPTAIIIRNVHIGLNIHLLTNCYHVVVLKRMLDNRSLSCGSCKGGFETA